MERSDDDLLTRADVARVFGVDERTIERMVADKLLPRPVKYGRQPRWRWGLLRRWMDAVELMQGLGLDLPPDDDDEARKRATKPVDSATTGDSAPEAPSKPPKKV